MTTHATLPDTATVSARIAQLPLLPMDSIWAMWDEHFDQRPNHHHRTWLESRLAYKLQERAFGGLKVPVRRKLESIGETGVLPKNLQREADRLLPGTILTRIYEPLLNFEWVMVHDTGSPRPGVRGGLRGYRNPAKRTLDARNRAIRWPVAGCSGVVHPAMETNAAIAEPSARVRCTPL